MRLAIACLHDSPTERKVTLHPTAVEELIRAQGVFCGGQDETPHAAVRKPNKLARKNICDLLGEWSRLENEVSSERKRDPSPSQSCALGCLERVSIPG